MIKADELFIKIENIVLLKFGFSHQQNNDNVRSQSHLDEVAVFTI
jgi:hypothetical protein